MSKSVGSTPRTVALLLMLTVMLLAEVRSVLAAPEIDGSLAVVGGYRVDSLDWNIAGDSSGQNPDILSELTWKDLQIYQWGLVGRAETRGTEFTNFSPCMRTAVSYGQIVSGKNQDSDYLGNNRTLEFSRSTNNSDTGDVFELSLAGGGKARFRDSRYTLAPLLGFAYYAQNLTISDGYQAISEYPEELGPFSGLQSTYDTTWYGPWLGLDATAALRQGWTFNAEIELHHLYYKAEADWNLRADLAHPKSFEHKGHGYGLICHLGSTYALTPRLELTIAADIRHFTIRDGIDRVFFSDGSQGTTTRLNEVNWKSQILTAGVLYHF